MQIEVYFIDCYNARHLKFDQLANLTELNNLFAILNVRIYYLAQQFDILDINRSLFVSLFGYYIMTLCGELPQNIMNKVLV